MSKIRTVAAASMAVALIGLGVPQARAEERSDKRPWIHVRVDEPGKDGTKVNINLPMSAVDVALDLVKDERIASGKVKIDDSEISIAELRKLWIALRNDSMRPRTTRATCRSRS